MLGPWKESYDKPRRAIEVYVYTFRQSIKKQRHHFADEGPYNQNYGFF